MFKTGMKDFIVIKVIDTSCNRNDVMYGYINVFVQTEDDICKLKQPDYIVVTKDMTTNA